MPSDIATYLDQLEEWLEAQVSPNLHDLPYKMLETMERMSNEIFESLNMHGPPSISIPFPPFAAKEVPAPAPPVPLPSSMVPMGVIARTHTIARTHPYACATGAALVLSLGLGLGSFVTGVGLFASSRRQFRFGGKFSNRGIVEDGMLKEAIVLLAPSPTPSILIPLAASLLKAGYIVVVAVPHVKDAEVLERRLSGLSEKSALRVLIYDPEDATTFPPFHRSLLATLTLRFPASGHSPTGDRYNPQPTQVPRIHAFLSLYPLHPSPPTQPGALPALPTLLSPSPDGYTPKLITLYPSSAVLATPETFASQILTATHRLLAANLSVSSAARIISVYVGHVNLPSLPAIISEGRALSRREQAKARLRDSATSATAKVSVIKDFVLDSIYQVYFRIMGHVGLGAPSREYVTFENQILRIVKSSHGNRFHVGQLSWLPLTLNRIPTTVLPLALNFLPTLPPATGPIHPPFLKTLSPAPRSIPPSVSASSSDHEGGEDLLSSVHTTGTSNSSLSGTSVNSGSGLEGSWVGLDAE